MSPSPASATPPAAAAALARAQSFAALGTAEALVAAVHAYDSAIALLRASAENAPDPNTLGAAWMDRGHTLHRQGTPESVAAAADSHRAAIAVLQSLPLDPSTTPAAALHHRLNLAGAWLNLAHTLLDSPATPRRHTAARDATTQTLDLLAPDDLPQSHPIAAELALLARRARCDALGHLIFAVSDEELARDLAIEAGDLVDDGLTLVRHWEQRGVPRFRPLATRLYHFGAQLYRLRQPQFLGEFLLEHLDPALSPGATPDDPALHAIAAEAIATTLQTLRAPRLILATDPATLRQVETLRALQSAEHHLAGLRRTHLPAGGPAPLHV